ncbi:MAG TPA: tetratricopeptide repeat protein, partial [Polyangia bacterium]
FSYLTLRFWLVFPLAVAGMVLAGRGERHRSLLLLFLAAQAGSFVLFFVNARFRLSVTPIMLVFAAYAVYAVATAAGGLRGFVKDRRARAALLMAVIAGLAIAPHPRLVSEERWRGQLNYAAVLIKAKRFAEAAEVLEAAKAKSTEPDAHVMLGRLALDSLGDADRSLENFRAAVAIAPNNADTLADAGTAHFFAGKPAEAIPLLSRAIARNPDSPMPQLTLAEAHEKLGQIKQAAEVRATLAGTFLRRGDAGRARREVDRALALDPENVAAQRLRGQFDGTP